jgi:hypothetical protein
VADIFLFRKLIDADDSFIPTHPMSITVQKVISKSLERPDDTLLAINFLFFPPPQDADEPIGPVFKAKTTKENQIISCPFENHELITFFFS